VSKEAALQNYAAIKEFVKGSVAQDAPIIPVSATQGVNLDKVLEALCEVPSDKPAKDEKSPGIIIQGLKIALFLYLGYSCTHNLREIIHFQTSAANQCTIDLFLCKELSSITSFDRATILNSCGLGKLISEQIC